MSKRKCLLTGYETNCTKGCYSCECGGEVALNDCYVSIYTVQKVCDIVRNMEIYSAEVAAEYIRNELEKMVVQPVNQWISCKDKMPEHGVTVLIYTGNHTISLAWYDKDMGYFYICDSDYKYNPLDVTHWRPLPEPPKEG